MQTHVNGRGRKTQLKLGRGLKVRKRRRRQDVNIPMTFVTKDGREVDEDNIVQILRQLVHKDDRAFARIAESAGSIKSPATISRILYGDTANPHFPTILGILRANGIRITLKVERH